MSRTGVAAIAPLVVLGAVAAIAVTSAPPSDAEMPTLSLPASTVTVTVTRTRTVAATYQGQSIRWWARRTVLARKDANAGVRVIRQLRAQLRRRWAPTVRYALALATAAFGVDQTNRARCESTFNPFAAEGHGPVGLLQFKPSTWASTPFGGFSIWDPVAQALAGGWMVTVAHRNSEWACHL